MRESLILSCIALKKFFHEKILFKEINNNMLNNIKEFIIGEI